MSCGPSVPTMLPARTTVPSLYTVPTYHLPGFLATSQCSNGTGALVIRNTDAATGKRGIVVVVGSATNVITSETDGYAAIYNAARTLLCVVPLSQPTDGPSRRLTAPTSVRIIRDTVFIVGQGTTNSSLDFTAARLCLNNYVPISTGGVLPFDASDLILVGGDVSAAYSALCSGGTGPGYCDCDGCASEPLGDVWVVGTDLNEGRALVVALDPITLLPLGGQTSTVCMSKGVDGTILPNGNIAIVCATGTPGTTPYLWVVSPSGLATISSFALTNDIVPLRVLHLPATNGIAVLGYYPETDMSGTVTVVTSMTSDSGVFTTVYPAYTEGIINIPADMVLTPDGKLVIVGNTVGNAVLFNMPESTTGMVALVANPGTPWLSGHISQGEVSQFEWIVNPATPDTLSASTVITTVQPPFPSSLTRWFATIIHSHGGLVAIGDYTTNQTIANVPAQPAAVVFATIVTSGQEIPPPLPTTVPQRTAVDVDPSTGVVTVDCNPYPTLLAVNGTVDVSGSLNVTSNVDVGGDVHIRGSEHVSGHVDVCGYETVGEYLTVHDCATVGTSLTVTGRGITGSGDAGNSLTVHGGNVQVDNSANISGSLSVGNGALITAGLSVASGGATVHGGLTLTHATGGLTTDTVTVPGGAVIGGSQLYNQTVGAVTIPGPIVIGYAGYDTSARPLAGTIRFDTNTGNFEGYTGGRWLSFNTSTTGLNY